MSQDSTILTPSVRPDSAPAEDAPSLPVQSYVGKPDSYPAWEQSRVVTRDISMNTHITKQVRVYIVDPHEIVRVGLRTLLDPDQIGRAHV